MGRNVKHVSICMDWCSFFFLSNHAMTSFFFCLNLMFFREIKEKKMTFTEFLWWKTDLFMLKTVNFSFCVDFFWCFDLIFMNTLNIFQMDHIRILFLLLFWVVDVRVSAFWAIDSYKRFFMGLLDIKCSKESK